ncbi:MAG: phage tail assembly chaperone [Alphaproteobacteria bacterium]|nr:phage tail assembly chaperone [Alphaproteobacteria bacterium]
MRAASEDELSDFIKNAMGAACGVMGWSPEIFWQSTPLDFLNAWHGFQQFHGLKPADDLTQDDVQHLRALLNQHL